MRADAAYLCLLYIRCVHAMRFLATRISASQSTALHASPSFVIDFELIAMQCTSLTPRRLVHSINVMSSNRFRQFARMHFGGRLHILITAQLMGFMLAPDLRLKGDLQLQ